MVQINNFIIVPTSIPQFFSVCSIKSGMVQREQRTEVTAFENLPPKPENIHMMRYRKETVKPKH